MKCEICQLECDETSEHHLIPRTRHKNKRIKKKHKDANLNKTVNACRNCHKQIHALISEKDLADDYYTLEKLVAHPKMVTYILWIRKRGDTSKIRTKRSW